MWKKLVHIRVHTLQETQQTGIARNIVKVHCNLRLVDNIETIGHSDANIDWSSSDEDLDWLAGLSFYELYFKIFWTSQLWFSLQDEVA